MDSPPGKAKQVGCGGTFGQVCKIYCKVGTYPKGKGTSFQHRVSFLEDLSAELKNGFELRKMLLQSK